jgi:hypothetical protein
MEKKMSEEPAYPLRVLLCLVATQSYYDAEPEEQEKVKAALREGFGLLDERFDIRLLGGFDDDLLSHGATHLPHYRAYILLDTANLNTVVNLCRVVKETRVGPYCLWRYLGIDARIGRRLPFIEV